MTKGVSMRLKWAVLLLALLFILPSPSTSQTRDPAKTYKVAILPFVIHSQENLDYLREGIYDILSSRITSEGRIVIIEKSVVERALFEERPARLDEDVAKKIGTRVDADYIVLGSLTKIGDYISLDARLISVTEEKPPVSAYTQQKGIDDVMLKIGEFAQEIENKILGRRATAGRSSGPISGPPRQPSIIVQRKGISRVAEESLGFKKSQTFNFEIRGLDIGDVDGDKKNEVVAIDSNSVYVFRYDGERLNLFKKIEAGGDNSFLTLDVADVNRNGHAEIIVTSVFGARVDRLPQLQSYIFEFEEGRFRKIAEKSGWYFRVLHGPKEGPILMGQQMGLEGVFDGPVYKMVWRKKSYEKGPKMDFPKGTTIFGLTTVDLREEGKQDLLTIDSMDYLNIISDKGKTLWRSRDRFGGTNISYDTYSKTTDGQKPQMRHPDMGPWRVYIPSRIIIRDLDGDGYPEVIINKNEFLTGTLFERVRIYQKGEIHDLVWDGSGLTTNWKTREIQGYIADYQIGDVDNDGEEELVVAVTAPESEMAGIFSRQSKSNILFFKLF
jgi:TolB-like protein